MPLVIPEGFFQASFHHALSNTTRRAVCTLGLQYTGADFINNANGVRGAWGANIMPLLSSGVTYDRLVLTEADGAIYDSSTATTGANTEPACPWNTAYLVKKTTLAAGRHARGRMYLPGVDEGEANNAGYIDGSRVTAINTGLTAFLAALESNDFVPVLLHFDDPNIPGSPPAPTTIVDMQCMTQVATQRRRLRG